MSPIRNVRSTSIPVIRFLATNSRFGEGFRTPARYGPAVRGAGPAFESLPRRKPRGGSGQVGRARLMGILASRTKRS